MTNNPDVIPTLLDGAIAIHEMVRSYEHAGFTRAEAIHITLTQLANNQRITAEIEAEDRRRAEERRRPQE